MIRFECDYTEGAHPLVMEQLLKTNMEQTVGYGEDEYCEQARALIKNLCGNEAAAVHFLVGGTQTNVTVIAAALKAHQGVLCATTGHINVHETGALEATGHKALTLPETNGKITAQQIENAYQQHWQDGSREHMVQPAMVYISQPTEVGTLYSKAELTAISEVCRRSGLLLFVDGARLGYGLAADGNDVTLADLAQLTDVFYIGGTKVGALFGEAVVMTNPQLDRDFRYMIKQHGGMLAKGRLLGVQFKALFTDELYFSISRQAVALAMRLKQAFRDCGCELLVDSYTNQQFPILPNALMAQLGERYTFSYWEKVDESHTAVRFCTSWATTEQAVDELIVLLRKYTNK